MSAELLREAIRATETHDWVRKSLMRDKRGRLVFASKQKLLARNVGDPAGAAEEIECDQVASCCAVGYLRFAEVCLLPVTGDFGSADNCLEQLEQLLWSKPEVREACFRLDPCSEEIVRYHGLTAIGEDGLLPFWNDEIAESKDAVVALFAEALERITPA